MDRLGLMFLMIKHAAFQGELVVWENKCPNIDLNSIEFLMKLHVSF